MLPKPQQTPWEEMAAEQPTADLLSAPASPTGQGTTIGGKPSTPTPSASAPAVAPPPALAMPTSDRCRVCGAPLASDQRYCVECGERRGAPRFALPTPGPAVDSAATSRRVRRRPRMTPSATLIAGVGTLLLAMGIGGVWFKYTTARLLWAGAYSGLSWIALRKADSACTRSPLWLRVTPR